MKNVINTEKKVNTKQVNNVKETRKVESAKIDLLNAVKIESAKSEIVNLNSVINSINDIEKLIELKNQITIGTLSSKEKLSLKKVINTKVQKIKINTLSSELIEKDKTAKDLTEIATFKNQVGANLLNLNNIVKVIKIEDKNRMYKNEKIDSKYKFLFSREFTNSIFYSFLTLRQFSKLAKVDNIFSHKNIISNCERIVKLDSIKLEQSSERGRKVYDLLRDDSKTFEIKIVEFTKL